MEENELLKTLSRDLAPFKKLLTDVAQMVQTEGVTHYPIFPVYQDSLEIGINIVDKKVANSLWSVNISSLEEFYVKQLVKAEKLEDFKMLYRQNEGRLCLFVPTKNSAVFVFMPGQP